MTPDPHCRIANVRLKGTVPRSVATRLPSKLIQTSLALQASLSRGARKGRTG